MSKKPFSAREEQQLMTELWDPALADNPLAFVMYVYPWGKVGTPLEHFEGPRTWQREELQEITDHIRNQRNRVVNGLAPEMFKKAYSSGRGIGKSAMESWLQHWMQSTRLGSSVIISANNEDQLTKVAWGEFAIWHSLAINSHWFEMKATTITPVDWFSKAIKEQLQKGGPYYQCMQKLWTENNPNAFAGPHNQDGLMLLFEEASGIPEAIWNVAEGYFTEPNIDRYWFAFSQSRDNQSRFVKCFGKYRNSWRTRRIDARTVEGTDKALYENLIKEHGEDSDVVRVEVKGEPPKQGANQFISQKLIDDARAREAIFDNHAPLVMGVDPARFGDDTTVIAFRQGRNARIIPWEAMIGKDNMEVTNRIAWLIQKYNPDAVNIDVGNGTGIIDRLRELKYKVNEVNFGWSSPLDQWQDFRTYMWGELRTWLALGCIPDIDRLYDDLLGPGYEFMPGSDKIKLEAKKKMKSRGVASPDYADALCCTFAVKVAHKDLLTSKYHGNRGSGVVRDIDYDVFG